MSYSELLKGKKGVVFGVANHMSIAWACAQACHAAGAEVAFNFLGEAQEKRVRDLLKESMPSSPLWPCDVSSDGDIETFFKHVEKKWGKIDFIIHSVAFTDKDNLKDKFFVVSRQSFANTLDISAYSLVAITRTALPLLNPGSSIVTMSYYGAEKVVPKYNVMGVAKAALESCTKYLAYDVGEYGVRVNAVSAGPIRTLSSSAVAGIRTMLDESAKSAPLRRGTTVGDVAQSTLYLVSGLSEGVTGEVLHVDCGYNTLGMTAGH